MKNFIVALSLLFVTAVVAQDPNYNGPAKMKVKSFWEQVEKLKVAKELTPTSTQNMERFLKMTKEMDPSYNTSSMESELKIWKDKCPAKSKLELAQEAQYEKQKKEMADGMNKFKEEQQLSEAIEGTNMQIGYGDVNVEKKMDAYRVLSEKVLTFDLTKHTEKLNEMKMYIDKGGVNTINEVMARTKSLFKEVTKKDYFDASYDELRFRQLHWDLLRKVYSGDVSYEKKYQEITATINSFGGKEGIEKTASTNNAAKIKGRKLDAAAAKDAALEKFVTDKFNSIYGDHYGKCLKVVLTQDGWTTERNQLTSVITGRNRTTQVAYKGKDGKCYLLSGIVYIHDEFNGNSYVNRDIVYKGLGGDEMLCENIK